MFPNVNLAELCSDGADVGVAARGDLNLISTTRTQSNTQGSRTNIARVAGLYVTGGVGGVEGSATLLASAGRDANLIAAAIQNQGSGNTILAAGNSLNLGTLATASANSVVWNATNRRSDASAADVGTSVQAQDDLRLQAGGDLSARAASVQAQGDLLASAGRDIHLSAGQSAVQLDEAHQHKSKGFLSKTITTTRDTLDQTTAQATLLGGRTVLLQAGQDIAVQGSQVNATQGDTTLNAGRDVLLSAAQDTLSQSQYWQQRSSGISGSLAAGVSYGKAKSTQEQTAQSTTAVGASVGGANVSITSGRDTTVQASQVLADQDIHIDAGRNVQLLQATDTQSASNLYRSSSTGIQLMSGLAPSQTLFSAASAKGNGQDTSTTAVTSVLSANNGNLSIQAGTDSQYRGAGAPTGADSQGNITTQGADLLARGEVHLVGNRVDLGAAQGDSQGMSQSRSSSLTMGAALSGSVGGQITQIYNQVQAAAQGSGNSRLDGALALKSGYDAYKLLSGAAQATAGAAAGPAAGNGSAFGISVSVGSSKSQSESTHSTSTQRGTNIQATDINVIAREGDLNAQGAKLQANNITLDAAANIHLGAAVNTEQTHSRNSSSSVGGGVTFGFGQQSGISFQLGASAAAGHANGQATTHDNTLITAANQLRLHSGGDTTLQGAQLAGQQVTADIGGGLRIESLQDQSSYQSQQHSSGFGVSLCIPPICYGVSSVSVNAAQQKIDHNYQSASGQSGINAGVEGFDITVQGHTELQGAALTSSAADATLNRLETASLGYGDLNNAQSTRASSFSVGLSSGASALANVGANLMGNLAGQVGLPPSGAEQSQTQSVISPATVTITGTGDSARDRQSQANADTLTSRDAGTANQSLRNTLTLQDTARLQADLKTAQQNQQAAQMVGAVLDHVIGDLAAQNGWAEGSTQKVLLHGLSGAIQAGIAGGSLAAGIAAGAVNEKLIPLMTDYLKGQRVSEFVQDAQGNTVLNPQFAELLKIGSTLVGAAAGAVAGSGAGSGAGNVALGASVGLTGTTYNRLLHPDEAQWIKDKARDFAKREGISESEATERLTQQALKDVDYVWRAQLSDGDDAKAQAFLRANQQTFTNDLGAAQKLFTTSGQQLFRPEMFADTASPAFYKQFAQSGITRSLTDGLLKEAKDSGLDIKNGAIDLAKAIQDNPALAVNAVWNAVKGLPQGVVGSFKETGAALGEGAAVALNQDLTDKLNAIYGTDVSGAQQALLAIRIIAATTGTAGTAKAAAGLSEAAAKAVGERLGTALDEKVLQTLLQSGGAVDKSGQAVLDLKSLSTEQKGVMGELFGQHTVNQIVPDGQKIARMPGVGETGLDDLYKVNRADVDYVAIEYKFVGTDSKTGAQVLKNTNDGLQGSQSWIGGSGRIEKAVGDRALAGEVADSVKAGRFESWVVTTRPDGSTEIQVLDALGKPKPIDKSKIILPKTNLSGAQS